MLMKVVILMIRMIINAIAVSLGVVYDQIFIRYHTFVVFF
jgi:hypothetical protein